MITKSSVALALLCALSFALTARAQEVTPAEKDKALLYLQSTKKDVLEATKDLSPAQWNFKSAPDRWSIAECMEHIAAAEDYIRGAIENSGFKYPLRRITVNMAPADLRKDGAAFDVPIAVGILSAAGVL